MKKPLLTLWCVSRADLRMLWFALTHPERPRWLRPATVLLVPYAIAPVNFVISVLGIVEDLVLVPRRATKTHAKMTERFIGLSPGD